MTTVWHARRVGDRILCGRRVPPDGPYACMGEIATIVLDMAGNERTIVRNGLYAEWTDGADGPVYREKARVRFRKDDGLIGGIYRRVRRRQYGPHAEIDVRCWAPCSHGGHFNRVGPGPDPELPLPDVLK